jgi:cation/acetate symporter
VNHDTSWTAIGVFAFFVAVVLGISFYLGAKAKSASGYYAAHGQIPWFVNGVAFAGDYLSAASFLGICGMIAFYGYDGFLYSIGYLAGWIVALLVIAEPLKRLGKFTFADALDSQFNSRGIKLAAAISTLVVSVFYLIPQMVGAGALVKPLLGLSHEVGVITVGVVVVLIVVTAGMVSTTWVQFIKGGMLVVFCTILVGMILFRGLTDDPRNIDPNFRRIWERSTDEDQLQESNKDSFELLPPAGPWSGKPYVRTQDIATGRIRIWRTIPKTAPVQLMESQFAIVRKDGSPKIVNGLVWGRGEGQADFDPVGEISTLPDDASRDVRVVWGLSTRDVKPLSRNTGPIDPVTYLEVLQRSVIVTWGVDKIEDADATYTIYYPKITAGADLLTPGGSPTFAAIRKPWFVTKDDQQVLDWSAVWSKLDFLSLMIALFAGTASLPHILIRYYTVKDQASARKSTVVGIASIGFFYVLTLFLGLGAMTSGTLDVTDSNMAAPLLARSFGELPFAVISAIAFTTVLGTVSGLILAASGAVAHDFLSKFLELDLNDHAKVRAGKITAVVVGIVAMVLGILFQGMNVSFLVGWAFNVAASANLPALVMLLFWRGTTKQGITAAIFVGMITSLAWILLSAQAYKDVYGLNPADALVPFSQPGIVTIPLGFVVLVVVSLMTRSANNGGKNPQPLKA